MGFISKIKVYETFCIFIFKFLQLLALAGIELWRGLSPSGRFLIRLYLAPMLIKNA
jgi:hypothetical protein